MTSINIVDLPLKNSLKKHTKFYTILNLICEKIKEIPEIENLCTHGIIELELINLVCNLVENAIQDGNKHKIDKKSLVVKVLSKLFSISPVEITNVESQIEYLFNNRKIKKLKISKKVFVYFTKVAGNIFFAK